MILVMLLIGRRLQMLIKTIFVNLLAVIFQVSLKVCYRVATPLVLPTSRFWMMFAQNSLRMEWKSTSQLGVGCFWKHCLVGAVCYADDIALLAPSPSALRLMLKTCTLSHSLLFNAKKTQLIKFHTQSAGLMIRWTDLLWWQIVAQQVGGTSGTLSFKLRLGYPPGLCLSCTHVR